MVYSKDNSVRGGNKESQKVNKAVGDPSTEVHMWFSPDDTQQTGKDFESLVVSGYFGFLYIKYFVRRNEDGTYEMQAEGKNLENSEDIFIEPTTISIQEALTFLDQYSNHAEQVTVNGNNLPLNNTKTFVRNVAAANGFNIINEKSELQTAFQNADTAFAASEAVSKLLWDLRHAVPRQDYETPAWKQFLTGEYKMTTFSARERVQIIRDFCEKYNLGENFKKAFIDMVENKKENATHIYLKKYDDLGDNLNDQIIRSSSKINARSILQGLDNNIFQPEMNMNDPDNIDGVAAIIDAVQDAIEANLTPLGQIQVDYGYTPKINSP